MNPELQELVFEVLLAYEDCITSIISALIALGGAVVGALFARNKERKAMRRKELISCYTSFFSACADYIANKTPENKARVVASAEAARLLSPPKSAELFMMFEKDFARNDNSSVLLAEFFDHIRNQCSEDLAKL